ncbi:MAG TPA: HDOD domain-containing protein [Sedimentisphaerales bacterium]|nr:HDOD domain-containing protein [Sedimentisphaerales bacterium]
MVKVTDTGALNRIELIVRPLDSLSTLPGVASQLVPILLQARPPLGVLAGIVESDAALTARILCLMREQGLSFTGGSPSVRGALEKISWSMLRETLFAVKVFRPFNHDGVSDQRMRRRTQLAVHNLAVASCAKRIAEVISPKMDAELAYTAGLLHDIGKLALYDVMPKSFERIAQEAKARNCSTCEIEQEHLGVDHTMLGKRLAQRWRLPNQITLAIWLHHNQTAAIAENMPEARIVQVVQLADAIARQCGTGESGSYDRPESVEAIAWSLGLQAGQLEQIGRDLPAIVEQKCEPLGLNEANGEAGYHQTIQSAAAQLAHENNRLSEENRGLHTASSHHAFITEFLLSVDGDTEPIDIAESFAVRWQRFFQTGMVCLYLIPSGESQVLQAVLAETLGRTRLLYLDVPANAPVIPEALTGQFKIVDAYGHVGWLFEQLDAEFDLEQTKMVPLVSAGKTTGALVFELRYPADAELFQESFRSAASIAGSVLDLAGSYADQQRFAEHFARLIARPKDVRQHRPITPPEEQVTPQVSQKSTFAALAEMAGGAAHELNNPLSVISGRAQLLAGAETDPEKQRILRQIEQNARGISTIIEDLMAFARPQQPRRAPTNVRELIDEALQLSSQKTNAEHINVQTEVPQALGTVFVDSAQIVSALANIICNSVESYTDTMGPVKITADADQSGEFVRLQVKDLGRGMDAETLSKATQPFFSGPPAGRRRGMGLAHAQRLVELNGGFLGITSEPGQGTTVTILLPSK